MLAQILHDFLIRPIPVTGAGRLGMLVPLALAISIVYKTIRCERVRSVPLASVSLCVTIVVCMLLIGAVLLGIFRVLA